MQFNTPLRYPGGKARLARYVMNVVDMNALVGGHYVEPYAGGAAIGLTMLYLERVGHIHLNDLNRAVHAFWHSVLNDCDALCDLIENTEVTIDERLRQKAVQRDATAKTLDLGFSTFFLNRTNRSGIIAGGVIGGNAQNGEWKIDARFNKPDLIRRIRKVAAYRSRITLYNLDAMELLKTILPSLPEKTLTYLDPPYYTKGQKLYQNHYKPDDHLAIAEEIGRIRQKWLVSYDNTPAIAELYVAYEQETFGLSWSARSRYEGSEIMIFGPGVKRPQVIETWRGVAA
jgi:DNA adenine methylase